jgi:hypothetical protein
LSSNGHGGKAVAPAFASAKVRFHSSPGRGTAPSRPRRPSPCRCRRWPAHWWRRQSARQLGGVALGLPYALGVGLVPGLGLHHGQFGVAVHQHIVCNLGLGPLGTTLKSAQRDRRARRRMRLPSTTPQPAAFERGVNVFGAGLRLRSWNSIRLPNAAECLNGILMSAFLEFPGEGTVQQGFFQLFEGCQFPRVDFFQTIGLSRNLFHLPYDSRLL